MFDKSICYNTKIKKSINEYNLNIDEKNYTKDIKYIDNKIKLKKNKLSSNNIEYEKKISPTINLRNVLTNFIVKEIINNKKLYILLDIINKIFRSLLKSFNKKYGLNIKFVYRGGNVLKIYETNLKKYLPSIASIIIEEFDEYFKYSDLDFYLYVEDQYLMTEEESDKITYYLQCLSFYGLNTARCIIMSNSNLINFCTYNKEYLDKIFKKLLEEMNEEKKESEYEYIKKSEFIGLGYNKYFYINRNYNIDPY